MSCVLPHSRLLNSTRLLFYILFRGVLTRRTRR